ncbi:MAG: BatA and WFA domain-containing protein [Verrucomicrobiaceae bacterium]|nr:BatA and WFA domain-containing protein [Verrucomicrobiaceae bacterium]
MTFLEPANLHWLWLTVPPVLLWLFRRRARQVPVSTLLFFRSLAREHRESAWLRQLKRWLSLLLTLLAIILAALALARPASTGNKGGAQGIVILLDQSASMALAEDGKSRIDVAKLAIKNRLLALPDNVPASLIVFSSDVDVLLSRSRNRRELARLLEGVAPMPIEDSAAPALEVAEQLAVLDAPAEVIFVSDRPPPEAKEPANGIAWHWENVAALSPHNVGISGFDVRPAPLERNRYDGFLRVAASSTNAVAAASSIEVKVSGRLAHLREVTLKPGQEISLLLPLDGADGEQLEVRLTTSGDMLPLDDVVLAALPPVKPLVVAWISEKPDPFTDLALAAMIEAGRLEVWKGSPSEWPPKDKPDVLVLENWLPDKSLQDVPCLLLNPVGGTENWLSATAYSRGVPLDRVRVVQPEHPVLYGIPANRLSLTQTTALKAGVGLEALWMGANEPLLLAGEVQGARVVVTTFSPSVSEQLALQPAYPLLLANAIHWCAETLASRAMFKPLRTGSLLTATASLNWDTWNGTNIITRTDTIDGGIIRLNRTGIWETTDGRQGSSVLASRQETNTARNDAPQSSTGPSSSSGFGLGHAQLLLWLLLLLVLLESFLFHRRAVY